MRLVAARIVLAVAIAVAARARAQARAPGPGQQTPAAGVAAFLERQLHKRHIPGLQYAVVQHGRIVASGALGVANVEDAVAVTPRTLFSINSATKAFTGVALLQLADAGRLDLDAPVSRYLDGLPAAWRAVTIRQLASHTSGLPDLWDGRKNRLIADGEEAAWARAQTLPLEYAPGQKDSYNQTNYVLLGRLIDRLGGMPFARFLVERQLRAAGMPLAAAAGLVDSYDVVPHRAQPYSFFRMTAAGQTTGDALSRFVDELAPFMRAGAGINTTAEELAHWIIALERGRLIAPAGLAALWTPVRLGDGTLGHHGVGWLVLSRPRHRAVGGIGGGRSAFYVYPDDDLAVVVLTNLAGAEPQAFLDDVASFYLPDLRPETGFGLPAAVQPLHAELSRRGFAHLGEVVAAARRAQPGLELREDDINTWGYRLLDLDQPAAAVAVLQLAVDLYPTRANPHDSLAEAYEAAGERARAIASYRRSLALDPKNAHAVARLRKLEASAAPSR